MINLKIFYYTYIPLRCLVSGVCRHLFQGHKQSVKRSYWRTSSSVSSFSYCPGLWALNFGTVVEQKWDTKPSCKLWSACGLAFIPPPPLPVHRWEQQPLTPEVCFDPFMVVVALHTHPDLLLPVSDSSLKDIMTSWDTLDVSNSKWWSDWILVWRCKQKLKFVAETVSVS